MNVGFRNIKFAFTSIDLKKRVYSCKQVIMFLGNQNFA